MNPISGLFLGKSSVSIIRLRKTRTYKNEFVFMVIASRFLGMYDQSIMSVVRCLVWRLSANLASHVYMRVRLYLSIWEKTSAKLRYMFSHSSSYLPNQNGRKSAGKSVVTHAVAVLHIEMI